jgi:hypothetical protein
MYIESINVLTLCRVAKAECKRTFAFYKVIMAVQV